MLKMARKLAVTSNILILKNIDIFEKVDGLVIRCKSTLIYLIDIINVLWLEIRRKEIENAFFFYLHALE